MNFLDQQIHFAEPPPRLWSSQQLAVFEAIKTTSSNLIIQAVAGSGKTTTILEGMKYTSGRSLFMAFNKAIAEDIRTKTTSDVKTLNALGWAQLRNELPSSKLNAKKSLELLKMSMKPEDYEEYGYILAGIIGLAKNNAFGVQESSASISGNIFPIDEDEFFDLLDASDNSIPSERLEEFSSLLSKIFFQSCSDLTTHDFNDQLYLPALLGYAYPSYDTVFVDECQDLSPIQHIMLSRLAERGARIIAVGDRHQAIYGFRGALHDSMDQLKTRFSMTELPLSTSYRCSKSVIYEAQKFCPEITARPDASIGEVFFADEDPFLFTNELIICRNNAPLFKQILLHVRAKRPCRVLTNFLDSFQGFIRSFKTKETKELQTKLNAWRDKEIAAANRWGFRGKVAGIEDKYETFSLFCQEFETTKEILNCIDRLATSNSGPTFSTIHKAKGLEAKSVYLLRPDLLPSKFAQGEAALRQEANLEYVAITRAKETLTYGARLT